MSKLTLEELNKDVQEALAKAELRLKGGADRSVQMKQLMERVEARGNQTPQVKQGDRVRK